METLNSNSKKMLWTGRVISIICVLFLLMDAIMKIANTAASTQGTAQLGWPADTILGLGIILLACTILYIIPATCILGMILLTGYLGGAAAVMFRADANGHPFLFHIFFCILLWVGLFLRDEKLRELLLSTRHSQSFNLKTAI